MSTTVRSLADVDLRGSLVFGRNLTAFPAAPRQGEQVLKDGVLWIYTTLMGISTWYPLTNKKNSYVHTQAVEAFQWTVYHGLGTPDVIYGIYDAAGVLTVATHTPIDNNSFRLNFTSAASGRVVVFADSERYAALVSTASLLTASVTVNNGTVVADSGGLRVNGSNVATLDGTGVLASTQVPNVPWAKITSSPTTLGGYGITDAYTKTETTTLLAGSLTRDFQAKGLTVDGNIMPAVSGVSTIGDATHKFGAIYTKEMHIDANTLYVDGVPVLGSSANTIQISADPNQGIRVGTTGTGQTILDSQASTVIQTNGTNANVMISAGGTGSQVQMSSNTEVRLTAPTIRAVGDLSVSGNGSVTGNWTVSGNLVVQGTQSQVNSTVVTVKDNIVVYNHGEVGSGVTNRYAGIQIDRGDLSDARMVWDEQNGKFFMGVMGSEAAIASENYVTAAIQTVQSGVSSLTISSISGLQSALDGKSDSTHVHLAATQTTAGFLSASDKTKLDGIQAGANAYTHPASGVAAGTYKSVTVDASGHVTGGTNPTTVAGYGITDAVTTNGNALPLAQGMLSSASLVATSTTPDQVVDSVSAATYRTVKYLVQITAGANFHSTEIIALHNGTTALATEYATVTTGGSLATFDVDVSGGNLRLLATPAVAGATFKVVRTAVAA